MKFRKQYIVLEILELLLVLGFLIQFFSNLPSVLNENRYVISNQSSIFTFKSIKANDDSGDYWLYDQDQNNYYTAVNKTKLILDYNTSWESKIPCNDLLSTYAKKPVGLEFIKCERPKEGQIKARAIYRVSGEKSEEVEQFLIKNYGMGKLKWTCCGWDVGGKYGEFEHPEFKKIDPYCSAILNMNASGVVQDKNNSTKTTLETNRNNIDYFTVVVELIVI